METRLPIPKYWQEFELLCHRLWRDMWGDPNAQRNGRQGQAQAGVDIFGRPASRSYYAGVQCKDKDMLIGRTLPVSEIDNECKRAESFNPKLGEFSIATTAARDAHAQEHARLVSDNNTYAFPVTIWSWQDIEQEVQCRPAILEDYYPRLGIVPGDATRVHISLAMPGDCYQAFFSRPEVELRIPPGLRQMLLPLCHELVDNARRHGRASQVSLRCTDTSLEIEDNGSPFNPVTGLDHEQVCAASHVGSFVVATFCTYYKDVAAVDYERIKGGVEELNRVTISFTQRMALLSAPPVELAVDTSIAVGRDGARRLAASMILPEGSVKLVLNITKFYIISSLVEFVHNMLGRIGPSTELVLYLPDHPLLVGIGAWFSDSRLTVRLR